MLIGVFKGTSLIFISLNYWRRAMMHMSSQKDVQSVLWLQLPKDPPQRALDVAWQGDGREANATGERTAAGMHLHLSSEFQVRCDAQEPKFRSK